MTCAKNENSGAAATATGAKCSHGVDSKTCDQEDRTHSISEQVALTMRLIVARYGISRCHAKEMARQYCRDVANDT